MDQANQLGVKHSVIGADSFYGGNPEFIEGLERRGEKYAVSVPADFTVRFTRYIKTFVLPVKEGDKRCGRPGEETWENFTSSIIQSRQSCR